MNRLDNEIKSILSNHNSSVPHDSWENIRKGLVEDNSNRFLFFYWMTGLLIISIVGLLAFNYINGNVITDSTIVINEDAVENASLDHNSYLVPLDTDMLRFDERSNGDVNNLVITNSSFKSIKTLEVENTSFIDNLKAIKESTK